MYKVNLNKISKRKYKNKVQPKRFVTEYSEGYGILMDKYSLPREVIPENKMSIYRNSRVGRSEIDNSVLIDDVKQNIYQGIETDRPDYIDKEDIESLEININELDLGLDLIPDEGDVEVSDEMPTEQLLDIEIPVVEPENNTIGSEEISVNNEPKKPNKPRKPKKPKDSGEGLTSFFGKLFGTNSDKPEQKQKPKKKPKKSQKQPRPKPKQRPAPKLKPKSTQKPKQKDIQMQLEDAGLEDLSPYLQKMINSQTYRTDKTIVNKNERVDGGEF